MRALLASGPLTADDHRRRAEGDEHVTVLAPVGDNERPAAGERHLRAVGAAVVQVQADELGDILRTRPAGHVRGCAFLDDASVFEDQEPVSQHERLERVMGDEQARSGELG